MKTRNLLLVVLLGVVIAGAGLVLQHRADAKESKKAVDFELTNVEGKKVKLSEYRGKVVVVDVWATWCGYCVREIPDLVAMQEEATKKKTKLQILGISVDRDKKDVKEFVKEHKINYPILYGEEKAIKKLGEVYGLPTKFILNKKGEVVDTIVGATSKEALAKKLEKHLK